MYHFLNYFFENMYDFFLFAATIMIIYIVILPKFNINYCYLSQILYILLNKLYNNINYMKDIMMDENDKKILKELTDNSRISISDISKKTGIPSSTVSNRIKKLEENRIIEGYTTILNPQRIGITVTAIIIIQTETEKHENVEEQLPKIAELTQVYSISGEYDILIKVQAHNLEELNEIINTKIRSIDGIEELRELIVMERLKDQALQVTLDE